MRTLVHLSDLHFGRIDTAIIAPLMQTVHQLQPDLVVVSGDLTQRARSPEFKAARAFLDALPQPQIIVPGNHDVPLHDLFLRFTQPLDKYRRYITADLRPCYTDAEVAVCGINTARAFTIKGGRINAAQVAWLREKFSALGNEVIKIVVTHHPFDLPTGYGQKQLVGRARMAVESLALCGADIFLAGHFPSRTPDEPPHGIRSAVVLP